MTDPKRRRDERRVALARRWTDFLIWIAAAAIFGWAIAALANVRWRGRSKEV